MAREYLEDAFYSLHEAKEALNGKRYHRAVRRAQESVELSLKALLRLMGVEYPREHDVGDVLIEVSQSREFPDWFKSELWTVNAISKRLAGERGPAFYGDEGAFTPPRQLYTREDADKAIKDAEKVYGLCFRLFQWWKID
ncbi:MAG: HEPN domain-containing protein [Candidatus Bathyarchaeia archaeon]